MPKFHRDSIFGDGPRVAYSKEQVRLFVEKVRAARAPGALTHTAEKVAILLARMLGQDGALFPSLATLAERTGCALSSVKEALKRLRAHGFLDWTRRLIRSGWRTEQTSNAYVLRLPACEAGIKPGVGRKITSNAPKVALLDRKEGQQGGESTFAAILAAAAGFPNLLLARQREIERRQRAAMAG